MDALAVLLADWPTVIAVLEKKSAIASDDENAAIWRRIAGTKLDMIEDEEGAVAAYEKALELDPESAMTVDALIALYSPEKDARRLVELFARRVELATPDESALRYDLNVRAAECYEKQLDDRREVMLYNLRQKDGAITPHGRIACNCTRGSAPQLNSKAGPVESISAVVPSTPPKI